MELSQRNKKERKKVVHKEGDEEVGEKKYQTALHFYAPNLEVKFDSIEELEAVMDQIKCVMSKTEHLKNCRVEMDVVERNPMYAIKGGD